MPETMFILGREPELSAAELEARTGEWDAEVVAVSLVAMVIRHSRPMPPGVLARLGGSIKQVEIEQTWSSGQPLEEAVTEYCTPDWLQSHFPAGRIEFGLSVYGASGTIRQALQKHFLGLKKSLRPRAQHIRFVSSREPQLSAVTVRRQGLYMTGREFVVANLASNLMLGWTRDVQDYQSYALRDFGRPAADPKSGMLPPKLSQMLLNLAQVTPDDVLLDPFCGSGTSLQEAALLGVKNIYGSDAQPKAVKDSQENLRWLMKEFPRLHTQVEIIRREVTATNLQPTVIVTEPWLGKPLHGRESWPDLQRELSKIEQLIRQAFRHWKTTLKPGGRVVMVWPKYLHRQGALEIDLENELTALGFQSQSLVSERTASALRLKNRQVLEYGRPDARLMRQVRKWVRE